MTITDPKVKEILLKADLWFLDDALYEMERDEDDTRTELEVLLDESEYYLELHREDGCLFKIELQTAKRILKETDNGNKNTILMPEMKLKYPQTDIDWAKEIVRDYETLKKLVSQLKRIIYKGVKA